ncbi:MAG TPA: radical SAM protein, partial [Polyangiaceae bacterium]|nr:radical SAM protein [Polyangiaceae bacterium]
MLTRTTRAATTGARALRNLSQHLLLASPPRVRRALGPRFFDEVTPKFLWLEATSACGNRCKFCSIGRNVPQSRPLAPAELETALRDPLFRRLRIVVVSGGEPTLRPDLDAILTSVHRAVPAARIVLSTSAPLPERVVPAVEAALRAGVRLEVGVSVDGLGPKHDAMRGVPGLFDSVDRTLRELTALRRAWGPRLRVIVSMVICDDTLGDVDAV